MIFKSRSDIIGKYYDVISYFLESIDRLWTLKKNSLDSSQSMFGPRCCDFRILRLKWSIWLNKWIIRLARMNDLAEENESAGQETCRSRINMFEIVCKRPRCRFDFVSKSCWNLFRITQPKNWESPGQIQRYGNKIAKFRHPQILEIDVVRRIENRIHHQLMQNR